MVFGPVASWLLHRGLHTKSSWLWLVLRLLFWLRRLFWSHLCRCMARPCKYY